MPVYNRIIPYIENRRCDSQNNIRVDFDVEPISEYIAQLPKDSPTVSYMSIFIAAYIRALKKFPQANRFIRGKRFYQRNEITVSFVMLKDRQNDGSHEETVLKVKFEPDDTLFDVCTKIEKTMSENSSEAYNNKTDKLLALVTRITPLVSLVVAMIKMLDYFGWIPRFIVDASPFHSGLFITSMMTIRTNYVYHHLYEFGTTSLFASLGKFEKRVEMRDGQTVEKRYMPVGVTVDERIGAGYEFACFLREFEIYMRKPKRLETQGE